MLAGLLAVFGDVKEIPFHAAYLGFSLAAAAAMWSLARRFSARPLWATLLFLAVPAFVVNGNSLETDVPFLAFWMTAIALFCADRLVLSALAMVVASLVGYQAIFLTPILAVYVWLYHRRDRAHWLTILAPGVVIAGWQILERLSTGALPADVVRGYFPIYQTAQAKLVNGLALTVHCWFLVCPVLVPGTILLAWRKRREPPAQFLLAWIAIFFACSLVVFFAGSARYLLPMAAPVAMLASGLRPRWLALGFGMQMALSAGLAIMNYQHWDAYRSYAASLGPVTENHRVWVDDEWGLRHYMQERGALPLRQTTRLRADDIIVSGQLSHAVEVTARLAPAAPTLEIRPAIPLRIIGLDTHSGYSSAALDRLWPFGLSSGVIDRVRADRVVERHPTLSYLAMNAAEAGDHIVSGIYDLEDHSFRWMSRAGVVTLKSPASAMPLCLAFRIPQTAPARRVTLLLDGKVVASETYAAPGAYTLESGPVLPAAGEVLVQIGVDKTFTAPPDVRELGIVLLAVGFQ